MSKLHMSTTVSDVGLSHRVQLFVLVFMAKFGSQSLGSLMIGATPVILKGPRHLVSWVLAFALVQLCPKDAVYTIMQRNPALLCAVRCACALYKLRKFNFVAEYYTGNTFWWMFAAQIIVIDGNNLCSRLSTWYWLRGLENTSRADIRRGLGELTKRLLPIFIASGLAHCCGGVGTYIFATTPISHPLVSVAMRVFVFLLFVNRYDVVKLARNHLRRRLLNRHREERFADAKDRYHLRPVMPPMLKLD